MLGSAHYCRNIISHLQYRFHQTFFFFFETVAALKQLVLLPDVLNVQGITAETGLMEDT